MRRILLAALLGLACEKEVQEEEAFLAAPVPSDEEIGVKAVATPTDGFIYATGVTVIDAHTPTRFQAPVPSNLEHYTYEGDFNGVPTAFVWSRLCTGDEAMRDRVLAAVDRVGWAAELEEVHYGLVSECPTTAHCEWLTDVATSDRSAAARMPFLRALHGCGPEHAGPALRLEDAPAHVVVNWYLQFVPADSQEVPAELERAILRIAGSDNAVLDQSVLTLVRYPGADAEALIEHLQEVENRQAMTRDDGYGDLGVEPTQLLDNACDVLLGAPQCPKFKGPLADKYCIGSDLLFRHLTVDAKSAATLAACTRDSIYQDATRLAALERLAWQDWGAAKAIATKMNTAPDFMIPTIATLRRFDSREAMVRHLEDLGLLGERRFTRFGYVITPIEEMALSGRLRQFTASATLSPVRHDRLLFQMAELAGPVLHEVVFEELAPQDFGPYTLRAYARGKRWSVEATDYSEQFDMRQTVGLLNVVLAELGSDLRYMPITSGDYTGWALGSKVGLTAAVAEGLFEKAENLL